MNKSLMKTGQTLQEYITRYVSGPIAKLNLPNKLKALAVMKQYRGLANISSQMFTALREIQKKYMKLQQKILNNVSDLVNGERGIDQSELQNLNRYLSRKELGQVKWHLEPSKIHGYWKKCLFNKSTVNQMIGQEDAQLLDHISNIHVVDEKETDNFTIVFSFSPNNIIKNSELKKKYYIQNQVPIKSQSTKIQWVDKDLTVKEIKKKQMNKKTGQSRIITKNMKNKSFFNFFSNFELIQSCPSLENLDFQQLQIRQAIQTDFVIGGMIVDQVIPYSLEYYLGIKQQQDGQQSQSDDQNQSQEPEEEDSSSGKDTLKKRLKISQSQSRLKSKPKAKNKTMKLAKSKKNIKKQ